MARLLTPTGVVALLALSAAGCGRGTSHAPDAVDRGREALEAALESWKKGEPVAKLKSLPEPIEFSDDTRQGGQRLLDYRLTRTDAADPAVIRYTAVLTLRDRRGKTAEREVTYSVALKSPITIARDPYF
jgi:hypothetical protein